jgi:hypothetical protein
MKKTKIIVIFSSHLTEDENNKFIKHVSDTIGVNHIVVCYPNFNQFSLPQIYNTAHREHYSDDSIMVFCHNDITFKTNNWGRLLLTKFNSTDFDIIGVAGSTYLAENGVWWDDKSKMFGIVEHTDSINTWTSEYSKHIPGYIKPVVLVDGLFIAVNYDNITNDWDEDFKGFHYYDISFGFNNVLSGNNIGVTTDIRILHQSIGMVNEQWEENRKLFIKKYKNYLPYSIK